MENSQEKIAIPVNKGVISSHFGHSEYFAIYYIKDGSIIKEEQLTPPPHAPGVIPKWLNDVQATTIITGGIGQSAINIFDSFGINVLPGAPIKAPAEIIAAYLNKEISFSGEACKHDHDSEGTH